MGHSMHLQSKQTQVNKRASNYIKEGKQGASLVQSPTRFGALSIAAEGLPAVVLQCGWHWRAWELKRESPSPRLRSAGGVSGP